jgi:hypothetical protein
VRDDQLADEGWETPGLDFPPEPRVCPKCGAMVPKDRCEIHMSWHLVNGMGFD